MSGKAEHSTGPGSFSPVSLPLRELDQPLAGEVHLWHLDFSVLTNPLSRDAGGRMDEFSVFQQNTLRRFYLRLLLGAYLGVPGRDVRISRRMKGRPVLEAAQSGGKLDFSVSRSQDSYLVGISGGAAIGVDLEIAARRSGKPMALAKRYFSEAETAALSAFEGQALQRAFMHTWACKEAVVKASGLGIANQLCRFTVDVNPNNPPALLDMLDDDPGQWSLEVVQPTPWAIAAVAVRQSELRLRGFRLE